MSLLFKIKCKVRPILFGDVHSPQTLHCFEQHLYAHDIMTQSLLLITKKHFFIRFRTSRKSWRNVSSIPHAFRCIFYKLKYLITPRCVTDYRRVDTQVMVFLHKNRTQNMVKNGMNCLSCDMQVFRPFIKFFQLLCFG